MRSSQTSRQKRMADEASSASQQTGRGFRSRRFHCACAAAALVVLMVGADASACPQAEAGLRAITNFVSNSQKAGRAPAGADCAYESFGNLNLANESLEGEVEFYAAAGDAHRAAANKRLSTGDKALHDQYLDHEIKLRATFIANYVDPEKPKIAEDNRVQVVKQLSALSQAMALRGEYKQVSQLLGDQPATFVDGASVALWLKAIRSCARWDGQYDNFCSAQNLAACRAPIDTFFKSVDAMVGRQFRPSVQLELASLRADAAAKACTP